MSAWKIGLPEGEGRVGDAEGNAPAQGANADRRGEMGGDGRPDQQ